MCKSRYLWYIPKHNQVVQDAGVFAYAGVFEDRTAAIEYLTNREELPADPSDILLLRTDCDPVGAAAELGADR